ncbi:MAG: BcsR/BcsP family cellulose biosynthesis protein [Gammaproteobacteria bacterium]
MDSDIKNLYASFDGAVETYREIYREEQSLATARRWRLLGRMVTAAEHAAEAESAPFVLRTEGRYRGALDPTGARATEGEPSRPMSSPREQGVATVAFVPSREANAPRFSAVVAKATAVPAASSMPTQEPGTASRIESLSTETHGRTLKSLFQRLALSTSQSPTSR